MHDIKTLLKRIGMGHVSSTAYDTAWVARLTEFDPSMSNLALHWLTANQLDDGSWGVSKPSYYHDRVVCTLSAMIALTERGRRAQDRLQIEKGLIALNRITRNATKELEAEIYTSTVGFEVIVPTLVLEAEKLGIIKHQGERILGRLGKMRELKLAKLSGLRFSRHITIAHSAEMAGQDLIHLFDVDNLQEANGSVANSPAATAYFARFVKPGDEKALEYLRSVICSDGGVPSFAPFDVFERIWVLWSVLLANLQTDPEVRALCEPHLDYLQENWKPGQGLGFSAFYSLPDGDDTSVGFEVLTRFGRTVDVDAVLAYEEENWFRCYSFEITPSIDVNVHVLGALRLMGYNARHSTIKKIIKFLRSTRYPPGYWFDKWHLSPYYTTSHVIMLCGDFDQDLCKESVDWILETQNANGSWGFYKTPTVEETAYCIQSLKIWEMNGGKLPPGRLDLAKFWLLKHLDLPHPPFWIDKSLYLPENLVQASVISALALLEV